MTFPTAADGRMAPEPADGIEHVFVYGTLRAASGHAAHGLLAGAALVGHGRVRAVLHDFGTHPGAVAAQPGEDAYVRGETYRLSDAAAALARLDRYEGCAPHQVPALFERHVVSVQLDDGRTMQAWMYFYSRPVGAAPRVVGGEYPGTSDEPGDPADVTRARTL